MSDLRGTRTQGMGRWGHGQPGRARTPLPAPLSAPPGHSPPFLCRKIPENPSLFPRSLAPGCSAGPKHPVSAAAPSALALAGSMPLITDTGS